MINLSVNINKIALIRNSRPGNYPDLVNWAKKLVAMGANGITIHPRPDQRHIRAEDAILLKNALHTTELNIEGNPFATYCPSNDPVIADYPGFMEIIREVKPAQCTLVPDTSQQKTSDHGFNLKKDHQLIPIIEELKALNIRTSLFMDADKEQIYLASQLGVDRIELYTGPYAQSPDANTFRTYQESAEQALACGLGINAGHDLNLQNLPLFKTLIGLEEVSIGHALTVEALESGIEQTIKAYLALLA